MKKILLCICMFILIGCSQSEEPKISKQEKYYNEILALEDNMKALFYFKMNKHNNSEYLSCDVANQAQLKNSDQGVENFRFHNGENGLEYISTTKVADEIQYVNQYYRNGKRYVSYSQLPYDISEQEESADFVYFDKAIKAVDLDYFKITKEKVDDETLYTITLTDAQKYNEEYPDDYNDQACGIVANYQAVKIELKVNADKLLVEETITQTIHYVSGDLVSEKEGIITYQFYDLGVEDFLDFKIIDAHNGQ